MRPVWLSRLAMLWLITETARLRLRPASGKAAGVDNRQKGAQLVQRRCAGAVHLMMSTVRNPRMFGANLAG